MAQKTDKGERHWRPVAPTRHHREKEWDYCGRAIYHFTLPVEGRYPLFGVLEGESAETAFVRLNAFGRRVCQMLGGLAQFYKEKGYALVVLLNDGFPKEGTPHERYYKLGGVYFETCSKGLLLLLEPTEQAFHDVSIQHAVEQTLRRKAEERHFYYTPIPVTSQRYRFMALNEMAKVLVNNDLPCVITRWQEKSWH